MQFDKHGNGKGLDDLYILPETPNEREKVKAFLEKIGRPFTAVRSDVAGHRWHGKIFYDVPFGESLREEIEKAAAS